MDKETSAYLDCFRFLSALIVMICHIDILVSGIFPFLLHFGFEAVGIFYILSGFVIGYVTDTKEKTLKIYAVNRAARLYSVVVPCLLLTFLLDSIGHHFHPLIYNDVGSRTHEALRVLFSLTFLNFSSVSLLFPHVMTPGSNGPFWTLCYEVPYYVIFGAARFLSGSWRWFVVIAALVCAGPGIVALFPLWLAGVGIYRLSRDLALNRTAGRVILVAAFLLWAVIEIILYRMGLWSGGEGNGMSAIIFCCGALPFAISIIGFRFAGIRIRKVAAPIIWLAGASFTLYLLHLPFASFLDSILPVPTPSPLRWMLLMSVTFGVALIVAHFTERRKHLWRIAIEKTIARFEPTKPVVP